jgi:hypothetical protein
VNTALLALRHARQDASHAEGAAARLGQAVPAACRRLPVRQAAHELDLVRLGEAADAATTAHWHIPFITQDEHFRQLKGGADLPLTTERCVTAALCIH